MAFPTEPSYVPWARKLIAEDFSEQCVKDYFCFTCGAGFCNHCCPARNLPGEPHHTIQITMRGGHPAVAVADVKDVDYDWSGIKRTERKWMMLQRHNPRNHKGASICEHCGDPTTKRSKYCSIACKLVGASGGGGGRQQVESLVGEDFAKKYQKDSFCVTCHHAFCSALCTHHQNHCRLIQIEWHEGWYVTRTGDMRGFQWTFAGVLRFKDGDDDLRPIQRRLRTENRRRVAVKKCAYCNELVPDSIMFCSLYCKISLCWP